MRANVRARFGAAAVAVVVGVMGAGCGGDDDDPAAGGPDAQSDQGDGGGDATPVGDLEVTEVGVLARAVAGAVLTNEGLLLASNGGLVLVDPETGEELQADAAASAAVEVPDPNAPGTTQLPGSTGAPRVQNVVASDAGRPYALLSGSECGFAEVDATDLSLGQAVQLPAGDCDDPVVVGTGLYALEREYGDEDLPNGQPDITYRVGSGDLVSGTVDSVDVTAAIAGYEIPFGGGLLRIADEVVLMLQKGEESTPYVLPIGDGLEVGVPEARPELEADVDRLAGDSLLDRSVRTGDRGWGFVLGDDAASVKLVVWGGDEEEALADVLLPDTVGAAIMEGTVSLAAGANRAYVLVSTGGTGTATTAIYEIS